MSIGVIGILVMLIIAVIIIILVIAFACFFMYALCHAFSNTSTCATPFSYISSALFKMLNQKL